MDALDELWGLLEKRKTPSSPIQMFPSCRTPELAQKKCDKETDKLLYLKEDEWIGSKSPIG